MTLVLPHCLAGHGQHVRRPVDQHGLRPSGAYWHGPNGHRGEFAPWLADLATRNAGDRAAGDYEQRLTSRQPTGEALQVPRRGEMR